ncbi:hypothetical protein [Kineococcus rhizosphaerae]|uniref:Uncharacterized protein n=1 Tax=Kineococcus rhizosphaerae TaxID=559628 RepID=A0A2T0QLV7_9ACTN|nr:hypothetical protein [Kineococcus rhizosphaerae]PRY05403.1 hypothetical protein CLV37_13915 [Kineococcus rhizosphaerae]
MDEDQEHGELFIEAMDQAWVWRCRCEVADGVAPNEVAARAALDEHLASVS